MGYQCLWLDACHAAQGNNAGMAAALQFFRDIAPFTPPVATCSGANAAFQSGNCVLTINWADEFRASRSSPLKASSKQPFGVSPIPGVLVRLYGQARADAHAWLPA